MNTHIVLRERYELKEVLGRGGFATTYLAIDTNTHQRCAIKCLSFRKIKEWKTWELFERETKILKALDHPQIPKHIDSFMIETEADIEFYLVQEYVEGKSLAQFVQEGKPFSEREVLEIALEITHILEYLHSFSPPIIHRDIKPSNIIVTPDDQRVYLIDFGAVREKIIADCTAIGGGSTIVGTYGYMPFEQFEGRALPASDIFSLGMTVIYLLSRKEPPEIEKKKDTLDFRPHVKISASFASVLDRMIARDWENRYHTASQVKKDLEKLRLGKRIFNVRIPMKSFVSVVAMMMFVVWLGFSLLKPQPPLPQPQQLPTPLPQATEMPTPSPLPQATEIPTPLTQADHIAFENLIQKSHILLLSHKGIDALIAGVKVGKYAKYNALPGTLKRRAAANLLEIIASVYEKNRLEYPNKYAKYSCELTFSPDGTTLALGSYGDGTIRLWNVEDGRQIKTFKSPYWSVKSLHFDHNNEILLALGNLEKKVNDWVVAFSPDNRLCVTADRKGKMTFWDVKDGRELKTLHGHSIWVKNAVFSPDGTLLASSGSTDKTIKLWKVSNGQELMTLHEHDDKVTSVRFSPDGTLLASASADKTIKLWNVAEGQEIMTLRGHARGVESLAFSPDGILLASGSWDKTIKLWDVEQGREITTLHGHSKGIHQVAFSPDSTLLASVDWDRSIKLWKLATITTLRGHSDYVQSVNFSPDGTLLASASEDKTIKLWNVADGRELRTLQGHSEKIACVMFSPDGSSLASGAWDETIRFWNVADGREIKTLQSQHPFGVCDVAFNPAGTLLASNGCGDHKIRIWNVADGRNVLTIPHNNKGMVRHVAFSPDGALLASASSDKTIKLWDVTDGRELLTLRGHHGEVKWLAFSPDSKTLASGSHDETIRFWDVATGECIKTFETPLYPIRGMAFNADWTILVLINGLDGTIKLWDVEEGTELATWQGHNAWTFGVALSPDGKLLASGSDDKTIKLWNLDLDDLLLHGCEWLHGYLKNNPNVSEEDRGMCDDVLKDSKNIP